MSPDIAVARAGADDALEAVGLSGRRDGYARGLSDDASARAPADETVGVDGDLQVEIVEGARATLHPPTGMARSRPSPRWRFVDRLPYSGGRWIKGDHRGHERRREGEKETAQAAEGPNRRRAALDGFVAEVIEDHVRERMIDPAAPKDDPRTPATEELVETVHADPT